MNNHVDAARWCACGVRIVGRGYVEATNPPGPGGGPVLCLSCAAEHARERPGDVVQAPVVVDLDECASEVATTLRAAAAEGAEIGGAA